MILNKQAKQYIREAIGFAKTIYRLFYRFEQPSDGMLVGNKNQPVKLEPMVQHAIMFCFKMIGKCIENAAKSVDENFEFVIDLEEGKMTSVAYQTYLAEYYPERDGITYGGTLKFWENLHVLRNRLVHFFHNNMIFNNFILNNVQHEQLTKICQNMGQIKDYFKLILDASQTNVNLGGKKYKVFRQIVEFNCLLQQYSSRDSRSAISQAMYFQALMSAVFIVEKYILRANIVDSQTLTIMRANEPNFHAFYNFFDYISTLIYCEKAPYIGIDTRDKLLNYSSIHGSNQQSAHSFNQQLADFKEDRIALIHHPNVGMDRGKFVGFSNEKLLKHITNLQTLIAPFRQLTHFNNFIKLIDVSSEEKKQITENKHVYMEKKRLM